MIKGRRSLVLTGAVCAALIVSVGVNSAYASNRAGDKCTKVGVVLKVKSGTLKCTQKGKLKFWVKQSSGSAANWRWDESGQKWVSSGTVPECASPLIGNGIFLDFGSAISKSQPGQSRGGSYKPHGGIRWSTQTYKDNVSVTMPFDATVIAIWHYTVDGVYQFGFNAITPCGVMLRIGHMHTPSVVMTQILSVLAAAAPNDSREYTANASIKKGDVVATAVGIPTGSPDNVGTFIDFGLVNLRNRNPKLSTSFTSNAELKYSEYSVCWYEDFWLAPADRAIAAALPYVDGNATSDYCQK